MSNKYEIIAQPLISSEFVSILSSFSNLLQTALGPKGKLKMIITGGGYSIVTSSSSRILGHICLGNPVCVFIAQVMKSQLSDFKDNGLYTGVLTSSLLTYVLTQQTVPVSSAITLVQELSLEFQTHLNSVKIKVDFSTVKQLLPVVKTVMNSKPACGLTKTEVNTLSISIVRAFLNSVNNEIGDVVVMSVDDVESENCIFKGVLYQTGWLDESKRICDSLSLFCGLKFVLLFNVMLSDEKAPELKEADRVALDPDYRRKFNLDKALLLFNSAVKLGVNIVACQKVVHPHIALFLRRKGVLLLDRMGTELTGHLEKLSGAKVISDLSKADLSPYLGHVTSLRRVKCGRRRYIALERKDRDVSSLLVRGVNSEAAAELKVTVEQALGALRQLLVNPHVLPGAGCMETTLAAHLHGRSTSPALRWIQLALLSAAGLKPNLPSLLVDTVYHHAWDQACDRTCRCGLVKASVVTDAEKDWINLDLNSGILFQGCGTAVKVALIDEDSVLDLFSGKINALKLALETCSSLMNIGLIVYKS